MLLPDVLGVLKIFVNTTEKPDDVALPEDFLTAGGKHLVFEQFKFLFH
jgi:hypothetical protein